MLGKIVYHCPGCQAEISREFADGDRHECPSCGGHFGIMVDSSSGRVAFVEDVPAHAEPLGLPRGSVRALVAMTVTAACWILMLVGRDVPGVLLDLVLTIVAYYFAYRTAARGGLSRLHDPCAVQEEPLGLPPGSIRWVIIGGFAFAAIIVAVRGKLDDVKHMEFFLVLAGLIGGFMFGRLVKPVRKTAGFAAFEHVKAVLVLATSAALLVLFLAPGPLSLPWLPVVLASGVSFYFGSRQ